MEQKRPRNESMQNLDRVKIIFCLCFLLGVILSLFLPEVLVVWLGMQCPLLACYCGGYTLSYCPTVRSSISGSDKHKAFAEALL